MVRSPRMLEARLWVVLGVVALTLCVGPATPVGTLFFFAPGYAIFRAPARHLFIVALCVSVASGIGFAELSREPRRHVPVTAAAIIALVLGSLICLGVISATADSAVSRLVAHPLYLRWAIGLPLATCALAAAILWTGTILVSKRIVAAGGMGFLLLAAHLGDMLAVHYMLPGYHFGYAAVGPPLWQIRPEMAALRDELRDVRRTCAGRRRKPQSAPAAESDARVAGARRAAAAARSRSSVTPRCSEWVGLAMWIRKRCRRPMGQSICLPFNTRSCPTTACSYDNLRRGEPFRWHERATLEPNLRALSELPQPSTGLVCAGDHSYGRPARSYPFRTRT